MICLWIPFAAKVALSLENTFSSEETAEKSCHGVFLYASLTRAS